MDKKAKLKTSMLNSGLIVLVVLIVLFEAYAVIVPTAQTSGERLNASGVCTTLSCYYNTSTNVCQNSITDLGVCGGAAPLSGLFQGSSVVFLVIMAALLFMVVKGTIGKSK